MAPAVKAREKNKTYLRDYATEFELPSKVIKGAKIYRKDPRYIFQVLNYLIPKPDKVSIDERKPKIEGVLSEEEVSNDDENKEHRDLTMVHTYNIDGTCESKTFAQQFHKYQQGACVRLLFKDGIQKGIVEIDRVMIGLENKQVKVNNIILKFSNNGKYLAIFLSDLNMLKIYDIENDTPD